MNSYAQGHRPGVRGIERARFIETRAHAIDHMRRRSKRVQPVHLFLAKTTHGRYRVLAQTEGGPLLEAMRFAADVYIGKIGAKQSLSDLVQVIRKAIHGKRVASCA